MALIKSLFGSQFFVLLKQVACLTQYSSNFSNQKMKKTKATKADIKKMSEEELEEYVEWTRHLEEIAGMEDEE